MENEKIVFQNEKHSDKITEAILPNVQENQNYDVVPELSGCSCSIAQ